MSNIGNDILELKAPKYPKLYPINYLGIKKKDDELFGDWFGALLLLAEIRKPEEIKRIREIHLPLKLSAPLPIKKNWNIPHKPEKYQGVKIRDFLMEELNRKNEFGFSFHSIFGFCSLSYEIVWNVWEEARLNENKSHQEFLHNKYFTNPIWYVGEFLKLNNIEYQSFNEFLEKEKASAV